MTDFKQALRDLARVETIVAAKRAAREPHANKKITTWRAGRAGSSVVGWAKNTRRQHVQFCVSDHTNVAGYILTWKEIYAFNGKKTITGISAFKSRKSAVALAERRFEKFVKDTERLRQRKADAVAEFTLARSTQNAD